MAKFWLGKPIRLTIGNKKSSNTGISSVYVNSSNLSTSNGGTALSNGSLVTTGITDSAANSQTASTVTLYGSLASGKYVDSTVNSYTVWKGSHSGHSTGIQLHSNSITNNFELYRPASTLSLTGGTGPIWLSNGSVDVSMTLDSNSYTAISGVTENLCSMTAGTTTGKKSLRVSHASITKNEDVITIGSATYVGVSASITGTGNNNYISGYAASDSLTASERIQVKNDPYSVTVGKLAIYCKKGDTVEQSVTLNTYVPVARIAMDSNIQVTYNTDASSTIFNNATSLGGGNTTTLSWQSSIEGTHIITVKSTNGGVNPTQIFTLYVSTDSARFDNVYDFNTGDNIMMTIPANWGGKIKITKGASSTSSATHSPNVYINDAAAEYTVPYATTSGREVCIHVNNADTYNIWVSELTGTLNPDTTPTSANYTAWAAADTYAGTTAVKDSKFVVADITMALS